MSTQSNRKGSQFDKQKQSLIREGCLKVEECGPRPRAAPREGNTCFCSLCFAGKEITLLMQTLNTLSTPEEKLAALCKKYAELVSSPPSAHIPLLLESQ